jgi:antitoxin MazE
MNHMETTIQKWGNSQGLRLAKDLLEEAGLKTGTRVHVSVKRNEIVVRKSGKHIPTLEELVAKIPKGYVHKHEDLFGKPVGKEVW